MAVLGLRRVWLRAECDCGAQVWLCFHLGLGTPQSFDARPPHPAGLPGPLHICPPLDTETPAR